MVCLVLEDDVPVRSRQQCSTKVRIGRSKIEENVQSMDDTWNVTQDGQQDVDEQVGAATTLEENTERREDDRNAVRKMVSILSNITNARTQLKMLCAGCPFRKR